MEEAKDQHEGHKVVIRKCSIEFSFFSYFFFRLYLTLSWQKFSFKFVSKIYIFRSCWNVLSVGNIFIRIPLNIANFYRIEQLYIVLWSRDMKWKLNFYLFFCVFLVSVSVNTCVFFSLYYIFVSEFISFLGFRECTSVLFTDFFGSFGYFFLLYFSSIQILNRKRA